MSLILASGSPRRKELLKLITEQFAVHPVDADETLPEGIPVEMAAAYLQTSRHTPLHRSSRRIS